VLIAGPRSVPSTSNCTCLTATLSDAVAVSVTEESETVELAVGAVMETVGGVVSSVGAGAPPPPPSPPPPYVRDTIGGGSGIEVAEDVAADCVLVAAVADDAAGACEVLISFWHVAVSALIFALVMGPTSPTG
jgi:hypothetical protein